jgi:4-carboxymuconolactone decarboxylase
MTPSDEERRARGRQQFAEVTGFEAPEPTDAFTQMTVDHVFAEIWTRPGLTRKERRWIALSCAAAASAERPLRFHVSSALATGDITIDEMREFVAQFAVYQGYPKAATLSALVDEAWRALEAQATPASDQS